ncbi:MAG: DEAD/DEAH box helicase [Tepidisphaeraceae bacterium]
MPSVAELKITPAGHAAIEDQGSVAVSADLIESFARSPADGLLHLAGPALRDVLPPGLAYAREFARRVVARRAQRESADASPVDPPPAEELTFLAMRVPPVVGAEYLTADVLRQWWIDLDLLVLKKLLASPGGPAAFFPSLNPAWHAVGRVTFHLAENKRNPDLPFAFLATYTTGVSNNGRPVHVPLSRALQEFADAKDRPALLKLLKPVNDASTTSPLIKSMLDSGELYRPTAWTSREAYTFLRETPVLEAAGLTVKVPDWWRARRAPRPQVSVQIGSKIKSKVGVDALLDFNVAITLDGVKLTQDELAQVMEADEPLVQLRGQWVEVDADKLQQALKHWRAVEHMAEEGIDFATGMRLLSGVRSAGEADEAEAALPTPDWVGIQPGDWLGQALARLRDPAEQEPPRDLRATLRPYQKRGYAWLRFMSELGLGACLADDMGLGKTVQLIALLLNRRQRKTKPSLLVVPASLIPNWRAELTKFAPTLQALVAHPSETNVNDPTLTQQFDSHDLVITTYGMLTRLESLRTHAWDVVVLDEAQAIKNAGTKQSRSVRDVRATMRVALSGTPIENRLSDLWSLFNFLNPGLLGSKDAFSKQVKKWSADESGAGFAPLRALVKPYVLRRLKTDRSIISDLPDKTELKAFCTLTKEQARLYQRAVNELQDALSSASESIQRQGLVLAYLMRFKQICNHPEQGNEGATFDPAHSGKFERLTELCTELAERQQRVLVFTQFREMTQPIAEHLLTVFGKPGLVLHGSTSIPARKKMVEQFQQEDGPPFFVLSIKAGGTGLNLTAASNVIHFDRWWNPAVENQATDRAFRIGQKKNVLVHKFVCRGTIEERIDALIDEKKTLAEELLGDTGGAEKLLTSLSDDELVRFVSLDVNRATEA